MRTVHWSAPVAWSGRAWRGTQSPCSKHSWRARGAAFGRARYICWRRCKKSRLVMARLERSAHRAVAALAVRVAVRVAVLAVAVAAAAGVAVVAAPWRRCRPYHTRKPCRWALRHVERQARWHWQSGWKRRQPRENGLLEAAATLAAAATFLILHKTTNRGAPSCRSRSFWTAGTVYAPNGVEVRPSLG